MNEVITLIEQALVLKEGEVNSFSFLAVLAVNLLIMRFCFLYCQYKKRTDWVDVMWAVCIVLSCVLLQFIHQQHNIVAYWVIAVSGVWYSRLAFHLWSRTMAHHEEDSRYQTMRAAITQRSQSSLGFHGYYVLFFIAQALLASLFSLQIWRLSQITNNDLVGVSPVLLNLVIVLATALVLVALLGQSFADNQLSAFKHKLACDHSLSDQQKNTMVCNIGLWKYSRHPNYFFEWLHWLSYPIVGSVLGIYWLWLMPCFMYLFLIYVTGIPFSEKQAIQKRGQAYLDYQQVTPRFFPKLADIQTIISNYQHNGGKL